ncbi:hypothetical protein BGY98DRAFT_939924 [Russula aff. rugulosa BPL654]|nr:hypothetical protein BGY98DRAFT_939924 [Russula aff. rugulosa BPL654]
MILDIIRGAESNDSIRNAQDWAVDFVRERAIQLGKNGWLEDPWGCSEQRERHLMDAVANSTLPDSDADAGARAPPTERIQFGNVFAVDQAGGAVRIAPPHTLGRPRAVGQYMDTSGGQARSVLRTDIANPRLITARHSLARDEQLDTTLQQHNPRRIPDRARARDRLRVRRRHKTAEGGPGEAPCGVGWKRKWSVVMIWPRMGTQDSNWRR